MPRIIDYASVLEKRLADGFVSLYHNSGAFGFPNALKSDVKTTAWIGPEDSTIRPAAMALTRQVAPPYPQTLAWLATEVWREQLPGVAWVLPMSHWSFELQHGHRAWQPELLRSIEIAPDVLAERNTGDAIEFEAAETEAFQQLLVGLLTNLKASDFAIAFPGKPVLCMLHHHQQLWWQTPDAKLAKAIDAKVPRDDETNRAGA